MAVDSPSSPPTPDEIDLPVLNAPRDGLPPLVTTPAALAETTAALAAGSGPVAVDTERAQGFRYSSRAYLLQFRRQGSGTLLVDPLPFDDDSQADLGAAEHQPNGLTPLADALAPAEWIIHAASQDLPCLRMGGLYPRQLFDTELAGRLLGLDRVGLGAMVERYFGTRLLKEHSAANWSQRPIPQDWLVYAALDVELLIELRDIMADELRTAGKDEWARQEFSHVLVSFAAPGAARADPWRRTSGINHVKSPVGLAVVREIWTARDEVARRNDLAPGKVLQDRAISELASTIKRGGPLPGRDDLRRIEGFRRRQAHRHESTWIAAIERVSAMKPAQLPPMRARNDDGPPPPKSWERHAPEAFERWNRVRPAVNSLADELHLPAENLLSPDALRRVTYSPPKALSDASLDEALAGLGVRPWQRDLVVPVLLEGLDETN
ncbi:HRDC domain-containing protein [Propionibacteriaceae bacterium G1746]|uniref:HRDC domain-containing protein n=1 Tax=Aestuariimicrobium sp. G57 TaxID=3418485 RepID=UPI003C274E9C